MQVPILFLSFLLCLLLPSGVHATDCYKNTTTRGVGVPLSRCASGLEKDGLLCYPKCKDGFYGVGPVCWSHCPSGYVDTGALCNPKIVSGDNSGCPWYDKCGLTFSKGCVKCPAGMDTRGCLCATPGAVIAKKSYGRGAGVPMICAAGLQEQAGLCYTPCPANYDGQGPVCWGKCPAGAFECGVICLDNKQECTSQMLSISKTVVKVVLELIACIATEGEECNVASFLKEIKDALDVLGIPVCKAAALLM